MRNWRGAAPAIAACATGADFFAIGISERRPSDNRKLCRPQSSRMVCQMQCLLTAGHRAADAHRLHEAVAVMPQVENLLQRAIECGAVIDPWNILGFGGQFSLFPAIENSIPDPRVDELLDLVEQIFGLYARLWHAAATAGDAALLQGVPAAFQKFAAWWDRFATIAVEGVRHISGSEMVTASRHVAEALAAWHTAGEAASQVAFWQPHVEQFDSPQAYSRVIEVLLDQSDLRRRHGLVDALAQPGGNGSLG